MVSGVPTTSSPSVTWIPTTLSCSTTMSMSPAQPMGMSPYVFSSSMTFPSSISTPPDTFSTRMPGYNAQSIPLGSNPFPFGMSNMTLHISSSMSTSNVNTSFGLGGTFPPYSPFPFGGGHIPQSFPTVGGWNLPSSAPNPLYSFQGWNEQMGGVSTAYISSVYPLSTMHVPTNSFIMENLPPTSGIISGGNQFYNIGNPLHKVSSSRGNAYPHMGNPYHITFSSQAAPSVMMPLQPFMNLIGGGYYPTRQGHSVYQNPPWPTVSKNQSFLGAWSQTPQRRIPFLATLNFPDLLKLMKGPMCHDPAWPSIPIELPSDIPKFEGKSDEDPCDHITTFHLWCSSNSLNDDYVHLRLFQHTLMGVAVKWYIDLPGGTYRTFNELVLVFLNHFQLSVCYDADIDLLSTFLHDKATHISYHIQEWRRRKWLNKATIPLDFLLEWFLKSLLS
jgi:hypothetical protein